MAKWEQWLKNDTNRKEKFNSKFNDEFDDRPQRDKKARRKAKPSRSSQEDYPFD
ncbi:hypothetical protein D515_01132 [Grimontia indica]|uniref:Uncharacterized protein n=2 Tax=Grimontia TaxID=246861 RepID=R1IRA8_9GAMM|nr:MULTISPECIES: hypothetical protein [Grimontia]EOD79997.1 hypothetical protein D515_01132 [Grimontia indica]NGN99862.1 hypothetical protein [Grimontia sedimenti]